MTNGVTRRQSELDTLSKRGSPLPFAFPGKLSVVMVAPPGPANPILSQVRLILMLQKFMVKLELIIVYLFDL